MSVAKDKVHATIALLCERWPKCFVMFPQRRKPLKIGIHKDIPADLIEPEILKRALRFYVGNVGYLSAMKPGAARIDLNGDPVGEVSEGDARGSQSVLILRRKRKQEKEKPPAPPPPRDGLAALREAAMKRRRAA
jgi:ProP effector